MASLLNPAFLSGIQLEDLRLAPPREGSCLPLDGKAEGERTFVLSSFRYREPHPVAVGTATLLEMHDEVIGATIDSLPRPFAVSASIDGVAERIVVDRARLLRDGTRQICHCLPHEAAFYHPRERVRRMLGQAAAHALGWDHLIVTPGTLGTRTVRDNVARVHAARGIHVPSSAVARTREALTGGPATMERLALAIGGNPANAFPALCAMMVRRIIEIDLSDAIGGSTEVRIAPPRPTGLRSIRLRGSVRF